MMGEGRWAIVKAGLPAGSAVAGRITAHYGFGMGVRLDNYPDACAVVDAISYRPNDVTADRAEWPRVGDVVELIVAGHVERSHQVKLRAGSPWRLSEELSCGCRSWPVWRCRIPRLRLRV